jgi:dTDP-4-amino-4,6-dideoxygalactose transaminase
VPRSRVVAAIRAEGIPLAEGYVEPIYLQPLYQQRQVYGSVGCPIACPHYEGQVSYDQGLCPVAERMHDHEVMISSACHANLSRRDLEDIVAAFHRVFANLKALEA